MELQLTGDGSHTLFVPELNEHYHSIYGAYQESVHVFIKNGLHFVADRPSIKILEIGFGTGLNAFITCKENQVLQKSIVYHGIEKYPVSNHIVQALNYSADNDKGLFLKLHSTPWDQEVPVEERFKLHKILGDLIGHCFDTDYDLVYFDAFAPEKQPEMWTDAVFEKMRDCLKPNGVLVTYCAKGVVKRALQKFGFEVQRLEGPPGKRHMLRGVRFANGVD